MLSSCTSIFTCIICTSGTSKAQVYIDRIILNKINGEWLGTQLSCLKFLILKCWPSLFSFLRQILSNGIKKNRDVEDDYMHHML